MAKTAAKPQGVSPPEGGVRAIDYGIDSPQAVKSMYARAAWTFAFGFLLWFQNRAEYPGPAASLLAVLSVIAAVFVWAGYFMNWSSRKGKLRLRDTLVSMLALNGDKKSLTRDAVAGSCRSALPSVLKDRESHRDRRLGSTRDFGQFSGMRACERQGGRRRRDDPLRAGRSSQADVSG